MKFQFHDGAIRSFSAGAFVKDIARFNSTMVRLEEYLLLRSVVAYTSFNSTMVRLEAGNKPKRSDFADVSIPRWCD